MPPAGWFPKKMNKEGEDMDIKVLLNYVTKFKGFVFGKTTLDREANKLVVEVVPRKKSRPVCSCCGRPGSTYEHLRPREFHLPPIWGVMVVLLYSMRRVNCAHCKGVKVESVPWSTGKSSATVQLTCFLAEWARRLSWSEVAELFHVSWKAVATAVTWVVNWGLAHRDLERIKAIGVDEIQYQKGHKYLTLVYQLDTGNRRLLYVGKGRGKVVLERFFDLLGEARCKRIEFVCSDMWKAYLEVIKSRLSHAVHVLDRFHIVAHLNKVVDEVRRQEVARLRREKKPAYLKNTRWIFLKKASNLTERAVTRLKELLQLNLVTVKAYLAKEAFDNLWECPDAASASIFIDEWTRDVMRHHDMPQMKKFVKMIRSHKELILNYVRANKEYSSGTVEGFNNKAKLTFRKSYGFRSDLYREVALYHSLGKLTMPDITHKFF